MAPDALPPEQNKPRTRFRWRRWLAIVVFGYVGWCGLLFFLQGTMLFPASAAGPAGTGPWDPNATVLRTEFASGEFTSAWLFPAPGATPETPAPMVAYFHGNAELIDHQRYIVSRYQELGFNVLLIEYRGYGHSDGAPGERAIVGDSLDLIRQAAARPEVNASAVIYHGRSIGSAIATQVAGALEPAALILDSSFTHAGAFALRYGVPPFLLTSPFRTRDVLPTLDCPVLLFHGADDTIIPATHSQSLHAGTPGSRYIELAKATHTDFPGPDNEMAYWQAVRDVIRSIDLK